MCLFFFSNQHFYDNFGTRDGLFHSPSSHCSHSSCWITCDNHGSNTMTFYLLKQSSGSGLSFYFSLKPNMSYSEQLSSELDCVDVVILSEQSFHLKINFELCYSSSFQGCSVSWILKFKRRHPHHRCGCLYLTLTL